jgi:hypothetical protein
MELILQLPSQPQILEPYFNHNLSEIDTVVAGYEEHSLTDYKAVYFGKNQMFRRKIQPPSLGSRRKPR